MPETSPPAWRTYGRILVERLALEASRGPEAGATVTSDDVRLLLGRSEPEPGPSPEDVRTAFEGPLVRAWDGLLAEISPADGLGCIAAGGALTDLEVAVLALCGAVELDADLARLCAVAHDRPAQDFVTVGLVGRALGADAAATLTPDARLRSAGLLDVDADTALAAARVRVARPTAWALAGVVSMSPDLPDGTETHRSPSPNAGGPRRVLVAAPDRVRRIEAAVAACAGRGFLVTTVPRHEHEWLALVRQATVGALGVVLDLATPDALDAAGRAWITRAGHLSWALCCHEPVAVGSLPVEHWTDVPAAHAYATSAEWQAVFPDDPEPSRRLDAAQLRLAAMVRADGADPQSAVRRVASGVLGQHAKLVVPRVSWDELILPESHSSRLRDLVDRYRNRARVHDDWGLPLFPSPGVVALFSGPSGTGKSTAAEIIAHELGMAMYRVDLSSLVSKYVGETEKNLEELFGAAHSGDYLLLFDEADSLFGVRSAVTDAKDRYANMEVSYLLQRLETYDGFVVLTSNFPGNIDQAFLRRIHVSLHFPVPGADDRRGMWTRSLARAPLADDLDLDAVAARFDLTGGSIRNAALSAAFLAAAAGDPVTMAHVVRAVTQEMTKLGRRTTDERFAR